MSIYLDNSATTAVRQEVVDAMTPFLHTNYGNPSSVHATGRKSKHAMQAAREQVALLLNCQPEEIYFSPCGTVSNNVALLGRARFLEANSLGRHLITTSIEHPSVLGPAKYLEACGWQVTYLPVDREGFVRLSDLEAALSDQTSMISVMWANNEIGTVEPIEEIAQLAAERRVYFHTDAVQVPGKLKIDLSETPISSLSLSGHKFYAPKGIGILFVRKLTNIMPIMFGGGQEMGLMPGTEGIANIVAIGAAAEAARVGLEETQNRLRDMQRMILDKVAGIPRVRITGPVDPNRRLPGHVSLVVPGIEGEALVLRSDVKGVCVSSGSACHNGIIEPSQVLKAISLSNEEAMGSMRISAGALNSLEECARAADVLATVLKAAPKKSEQMPV